MTLTEFLLARIAEHEAAAREPQGYEYAGSLSRVFDPAYVLAECEAKRQIVETHAHRGGYGIPDHHACPSMPRTLAESAIFRDADPCDTLRLLALPYADHPDYRKEWKP